MDDVQVYIRKGCPECKGVGTVQHPAWKLYWETFGLAGTQRTEAQDRAWFAEYGISEVRLPPEEIECGECFGTGKVEGWEDSETFMYATRELSKMETALSGLQLLDVDPFFSRIADRIVEGLRRAEVCSSGLSYAGGYGE